MRTIVCSGTPYEIGYQHGEQARDKVHGSIAFYQALFKKNVKLDWEEVRRMALQFEPSIRERWPTYLQEMLGLAHATGLQLADILALNVRTEINFGMFNDGCTALSWKTDTASYLAQNWDWMAEQKANLIPIVIHQFDKPTIRMITEAGIIGKIGFNSRGVGVCLNAIRAKGMDPSRMPCHLGLRLVLDSDSCEAAVHNLDGSRIASSCHMLIADSKLSIGVEWSSIDVKSLQPNAREQIFHSNHYLAEHPGVVDTAWLKDSPFRVDRVKELCKALPDNPTLDQIRSVFRDEENYPASICRCQTIETGSETVFNIVMDLQNQKVKVAFGRPTQPDEEYQFPE